MVEALVVLILAIGGAPKAEDAVLIESLRDAQETNKEAWSSGRSDIHVEIVTPRAGAGESATIDGEVTWLKSNFLLKFKVTDPNGTYFQDRGAEHNQPWNFIARGDNFVVTYSARSRALNERPSSPNAFRSLFDLSPFTEFATCCPPTASAGRPWKDLIGPSPSLPTAFAGSTFTHNVLPNGDVEQTRLDEDGNKVTIVFGKHKNLAVTEVKQYSGSGKLEKFVMYQYAKNGKGMLIPAACQAELYQANGNEKISFKYEFKHVLIPGQAKQGEFARSAVLARIRRESGDSKSQAPGANKATDDATLESMAKGLKESGTAKPKP